MSETAVRDATPADGAGISSLERTKERGFSEDERHEIITRLQTVENVCAGLSSQLSYITSELFPLNDPPEGEAPSNVNMVREIHGFCVRLSGVLDAMGANPMVAAMLPPGALD